jgi:hypothetical protein
VLEAVGGALNNAAVVLFGKPDTYFHGRGIEIADAIVRDRRPEHKSLLVFIDSNVDVNLLGEEGYAYVGKVSVEADPDRNWDQGYKAVVAETLLWDVDILLISGGMKGVTTGSNTTFPSAAGGYSQANYSLSLMGGKAKGITEGQGKAMLSGEAYRYAPQMIERRRIPAAIYDRIRCRPQPPASTDAVSTPPRPETAEPRRLETSKPVEDLAPQATRGSWAPSPRFENGTGAGSATPKFAFAGPSAARNVATEDAAPATQTSAAAPAWRPAANGVVTPSPAAPGTRRVEPRRPTSSGPGITMSQELLDMAGFSNDQEVGYVQVRP